eukprot:6069824-Amphidinium_carterae.1
MENRQHSEAQCRWQPCLQPNQSLPKESAETEWQGVLLVFHCNRSVHGSTRSSQPLGGVFSCDVEDARECLWSRSEIA